MKWTNCFLKTKKNITEDCLSYKLLIQAGLVDKASTGVFNYHSILLKSIKKLENIIRKELEIIDYEEMLLSQIHSKQIWEQSGRWEKLGDNLIKFKNRQEQEFCLAATHEESVIDFVKNNISSYKDLDIKLYQIQNKFRDELRAKLGLIRAKEFIMKDAYSFAKNKEDAYKHYLEMVQAYKNIFDQLEIKYIVVEADAGAIGGYKTHEFQMLSNVGDDLLFLCNNCKIYGNKEILKEYSCHVCRSKNLTWQKGIELGHCFLLGTEYSKKMNFSFNDKNGKKEYVHMECYGIGVSRIIQAIFEQLHDQYGLIWSKKISAYEVHLVNLGGIEEKAYTQEVYNFLKENHIEVFWDDREESAGVKLHDMDKLGFTYQVIVGKNMTNEKKLDFCLRKDKNKIKLTKEEILVKIKE